ncbi:phage portal protein family protein [Nocardioides lianchengensis]|uniref:Portal protein n=1 Tax=Nocardioides lianchengensis TaxID=1045774 RepID=A0A1G6LT02_9ACTN|nr:hypothetical protein [Nocardioides lianchengensis]NYG12467.1 hypothetical protein [Nocardioides lianchengensis]SDC45816.1 Protein of unknown function [Nocardioides lianchengensis]
MADADAPPSPQMTNVPQRELGIGDTGATTDWWDSLTLEKVPELRWPTAYGVYDDMLTSPQVAGVFSAVVQTILGTGWRLDGTGCREDIVQHVARDLSVPIVGVSDQDDSSLPVEDKFSWDEHVEIAIDEYLRYGHSIYEQKAQWGDDNRWHLAKLGWRSGRTITRYNVARDGGLISLEQSARPSRGSLTTAVTAKPTPLPVGRIVVYVRNRRGGNWRGESVLRPSYPAWMMSSRGQRLELILGERAGAPVVVYEAAQGETDLTKGKAIATAVRVGREAGVAIPAGAKLTLKGIDGTLPDLDKVIRRHDERIAGSMLANFLNLGSQSGTGSYALGSTFFNAFVLALQKTAKDIARTASRHVVADLVRWNWPGERAPCLVFDEIGARRDALVQALATLVQAGVLTADQDLEQFVRAAIGVPARDGARPPLEES